MVSTKNSKGYALMDIMKFAFACVIVLLHTNSFTRGVKWFDYSTGDVNAIIKTFGIAPVLRLGVPFFFVSSAYFLFSKLERSEDKRSVIIAYCKRNMILFGAWFLINIAFIVKCKHLFDFLVNGHILKGLIKLFIAVFLDNTFLGSWFLVACVIDAIILGILLYGIKSDVLAWIIACICFLPCIISSFNIPLPDIKIAHVFLHINSRIGSASSFMSGLIYFMVGRTIAKHKDKINIKMSLLIILTVIAYVLMLLELFAAKAVLHASTLGGSFFMRTVVIALLVLICLKCKMGYKPGYLLLRKSSTIIFCSHGSILWMLQGSVGRVIPWNKLTAFCCAFLICILLSYVIIKASEKYKVFKYLY